MSNGKMGLHPKPLEVPQELSVAAQMTINYFASVLKAGKPETGRCPSQPIIEVPASDGTLVIISLAENHRDGTIVDKKR